MPKQDPQGRPCLGGGLGRLQDDLLLHPPSPAMTTMLSTALRLQLLWQTESTQKGLLQDCMYKGVQWHASPSGEQVKMQQRCCISCLFVSSCTCSQSLTGTAFLERRKQNITASTTSSGWISPWDPAHVARHVCTVHMCGGITFLPTASLARSLSQGQNKQQGALCTCTSLSTAVSRTCHRQSTASATVCPAMPYCPMLDSGARLSWIASMYGKHCLKAALLQ